MNPSPAARSSTRWGVLVVLVALVAAAVVLPSIWPARQAERVSTRATPVDGLAPEPLEPPNQAPPPERQPPAPGEPAEPEPPNVVSVRIADLRRVYHSRTADLSSLHKRLADLLLVITPATEEALAILAEELAGEIESPEGSPDIAGLLAFALSAAGREAVVLEHWDLVKGAEPPVMPLLAVGLRLDVEAAVGAGRAALDDAVAGVMLTRLCPVCEAWRRAFFKERLGDRHPGEAPRPTFGDSPLEVLDVQLRRSAGERLTRSVSESLLGKVREYLLESQCPGNDAAAMLNALHLYQRDDPVVKRDLVEVAVSERVAKNARLVALRLLSHPLEPQLQQRLLESARREYDPDILPVLVDALRITDTRPGPLLQDLFQRAATPEARRAVGRVAASLADQASDPVLAGVLQYVADQKDGELLVEIMGRLERRKLLDRREQPLIDAISAVLRSADEAMALRVLEFVRAHRMGEMEPTLRSLSTSAASPKVAEAARGVLGEVGSR